MCKFSDIKFAVFAHFQLTASLMLDCKHNKGNSPKNASCFL